MPEPVKTVQDFKVFGSNADAAEWDPQIVALANGQFDVSWTQDAGISPLDRDVRITRLNADGTSALADPGSGGVSLRDPVDNEDYEGVLATVGTMQVVAYSDVLNSAGGVVLRLDFYDAATLNQGGVSRKSVVVDMLSGYQSNPEIVVLKDGKLAVAYVDLAAGAVKARVFDPATDKFTSEPFTLSESPTTNLGFYGELGLTALSNGGFATSWLGLDFTAHLQVCDARGKTIFTLTDNGQLGQPTDILDVGENKLAVVSAGPANIVKFTVVDLASKTASPSVEVAAYGQKPDAVLLDDGRIMIVWLDGGDIVGRIVEADGSADSDPFLVADTADNLAEPHLAKLADGRVALSYSNLTNWDIYAAIYDPREAAVSLKGTAGDDQFTGTRFADKFATGAGNDTVWADGGNDRIDGGTGADRMIGGTGDDIYVVDNAGDRTVEAAGGGKDTVRSSISWSLAKNVEVLQLAGTANINGTGNGGTSTVIGNSGNNIISAAGTMIGGAGNDTYSKITGTEKIVEAAGGGIDRIKLLATNFVLAAGVEIERITAVDATALAKTSVAGNEFAQTIEGTAGDNILDGKGGADRLIGFGGNDTYVVDNAGDKVIEQADAGIDTVKSSISWTLGANLERLILTGTANTDAVGNNNNNTLVGNAGNNLLYKAGAGGTMIGGLGDDTYLVSGGEKIVEARGGGNDRVEVDGYTYALAAGIEIERLASTYMLRSNGVTLSGNEFAQKIVGSMGNDVLSGKGGADTLEGFLGDDTYAGVTGTEIIVEGVNGGTDTIKLATTSYTLAAGVEVERISAAGLAKASIVGNEFAQTLTGTRGNDTLDGKGGADTLIGQAGDDIYVVDNIGDSIVEASDGGTDTVRSSITWTLGANTENLLLTGSANIDATGNGNNNTLTGNDGNNTLRDAGVRGTMAGGLGDDTYFVATGERVVESAGQGYDSLVVDQPFPAYTLDAGVEIENLRTGFMNTQADIGLYGNEFGQTIIGTNGSNVLDGKGGSDLLIGLRGNDTFVFASALGSGNVDRIAQFDKSATDQDRINLDHSIFTKLTVSDAPLHANFFSANAAGVAQDADDRIVYETDTGKLFYDADGNGKGAAILFAVLDDRAALTASDFFVV